MSTTTTNYDLIKPELTDVADITAMNQNWDKIDAELKKGEAFVVTATIMPSSVTLDKTFDEIYTAWSNGTKVYMSVSGGRYILTPSSVSSSSINFTTVYSYNGKLTLWVVGVFSNNTADQITYVFPTTVEMENAIAAIPTPDVSGQIEEHDNDANAHSSIRNAMMPKAGGTMTGNLKISRANSPTIELQTSNSNGYTNIYQHGGLLNISSSMSNDDSDETSLEISVPSDDDSDLVRIGRTVNGSSKYYKLYGEHNKPTAEDVGASFANAGSHNSIYRGKYLGSAVTDAQWAAIKAGTFEDLYIGDYWTINGVNYRIAAFDYYYNTGDTACTRHHVVLVPDTYLYSHVMNDTNITTGAYVGSKMYTEGLETAKETINAAFGSAHILNHRQYLQNAVTDGYASGGSWYDSTVELMTEQNVYGGKIYGNQLSGTALPNKYTIDKSQYPLFAFRPDMISNRLWFWLRDVVSASLFALVYGNGSAIYSYASDAGGVRPEFSIYSA